MSRHPAGDLLIDAGFGADVAAHIAMLPRYVRGGHTTGSVIVFVTPPTGPRYAFIGDLTWQIDGIRRRVERPWLLSRLADSDPVRLRHYLLRMIALDGLLRIVPAHDLSSYDGLPRLIPES